MATAAYEQTIASGTVTEIFNSSDGSGGATTFGVKCKSGEVLIQVDDLHASTDWYRISAGEFDLFRSGHGGIGLVKAQGKNGAAVIDYGVVSRTVS